MWEAAAIVNSRPLTVDNLNDPLSLAPITPNHLLTMKSKVITAPPGEFGPRSLYALKRWKRVQYLADLFWTRWRKEMLQSYQSRQKWTEPRQNLKVDDLVLVVDESVHRSDWKLARIVDTKISIMDGLVRSVTIQRADRSVLRRPVHKLIKLLLD